MRKTKPSELSADKKELRNKQTLLLRRVQYYLSRLLSATYPTEAEIISNAMKGMSLHTKNYNWTVTDKEKYLAKEEGDDSDCDDDVDENEKKTAEDNNQEQSSSSASNVKASNVTVENVSNLFETQTCDMECLPFFLDNLKKINSFVNIIEPFCGKGSIVNYLESIGYSVLATDKFHYGKSIDIMDESFLVDSLDIIVTKPPFINQEKFIKRVLDFEVSTILLLPMEIMTHEFFHELSSFNAFITISPVAKFKRNDEFIETNHGSCAWFFFNFPKQVIEGVLHFNSSTGLCSKKGAKSDIASPEGKKKRALSNTVSPVKIDLQTDIAGYVPCDVCKKCDVCNDSSCDTCLMCNTCGGSGRVIE